jgi:hypothetical protein
MVAEKLYHRCAGQFARSLRIAIMSTNVDSPLRILHCPEIVGGQAHQLACSERELGQQSASIVFRESPYHYPADEILCRRDDSRWIWGYRRLQLFRRALWDYDVIHFNFGKSIFPEPWIPPTGQCTSWKSKVNRWLMERIELRDLPLFKSMGKVIAVSFQGDDARQGDRLHTFAEARLLDEIPPGYYRPEADAHKRWRIAQFARWADLIYAFNPDLMHVLPAKTQFVPYVHVNPRDWQVVESRNDVPLVLHAPTHRGIKGTKHVLDAVNQLKAEGVAFRFELIEGLSHAEAMRRYQDADVLIDQLLLGWYGGLAVELMALGKPVICHIREGDLRFIPQAMRESLPIIRAHSGNVAEVLRTWLTNRKSELALAGARSRRFVERWHDPQPIAAGMIEDYRQARRGRKQAKAG